MEAFLKSNTTEPDGSSISDSNNVSNSTTFEEAFPPDLMSDVTVRGIETVVQVGLLPVLMLCGVTGVSAEMIGRCHWMVFKNSV